jgi:sugar phosphate isomerase/epimerase
VRLVAELAEAGFTGVSFDPGRQEVRGNALRDAVEEHDLTVTVHSHEPVLCDRAAELSDLFGERLVNVTNNVIIRHDSRGMPIDGAALCANTAAIIEATPDRGFTVGVEDFPRDSLAMEYFARDLAPLLDSPRLGVLMDLGHMHLWLSSRPYYAGVTPEQYLENVPVKVTEVHLHDNDGTRDAHQPLGRGTSDLDATARGLRAIGFDGVCTVEIRGEGKGSVATLSQYVDAMGRMQGALGKAT